MRPSLLLMPLAAVARLHPTPIEAYLAKNANILKEYTLSAEDNAQLTALVQKTENLQQLVQGKIPFDINFLKKYKEATPDQIAIVKNYLRRMDMKVLASVHSILGFFYDQKDKLLPLGPALANWVAHDIDIKECMYEILVWWLDSTPGGKLNTRAMLTRLQGAPLDDELHPFLVQATAAIRRHSPALLQEIEIVFQTAQEDFKAFPDPLYNYILRLLAPR